MLFSVWLSFIFTSVYVCVCALSVLCCIFLLFCVCKCGIGKSVTTIYLWCILELVYVPATSYVQTTWRSWVCLQGISHVSVQQQGNLYPVLKDVWSFCWKLTCNTCDSNVSCLPKFKLMELCQMECQTIAYIYAARTHIMHGSCFERSDISMQ
jgi:hypothetical protein